MILVGERSRPYRRVPPKFSTEGLPYGAFCKCNECGYVGRSTATLDYYPDKERKMLMCGACKGFDSLLADKVADARLVEDPSDCDHLGPGCRGGYEEWLDQPLDTSEETP